MFNWQRNVIFFFFLDSVERFTHLFNIFNTNWGKKMPSYPWKFYSQAVTQSSFCFFSNVLWKKKNKKTKQRNDRPIIPRHCCQLFGRHRTEQGGPLSIIDSPLVVLSTRPMHILKKYPVNMLCIGLVRRLDKKNQHPRNWCELRFPASAHSSLPECSVARGPKD